jgi:lipopolysaccharide biosynthesis protein
LQLLLDAHLDVLDFEAEAAQRDGTLAHAVERAFSLCATAGGFAIKSAASLVGQEEGKASPYPYAQRSG